MAQDIVHSLLDDTIDENACIGINRRVDILDCRGEDAVADDALMVSASAVSARVSPSLSSWYGRRLCARFLTSSMAFVMTAEISENSFNARSRVIACLLPEQGAVLDDQKVLHQTVMQFAGNALPFIFL